jgi:hypothetical protein
MVKVSHVKIINATQAALIKIIINVSAIFKMLRN